MAVHVIHMMLQQGEGNALMPHIQQRCCLHCMLYVPCPHILQQLQSVHGHVIVIVFAGSARIPRQMV